MCDSALTGTRNVLEGLRQAGAGRAVLLTGVIVIGARYLDAATEELPYRRSGDPIHDIVQAMRLAAQTSAARG